MSSIYSLVGYKEYSFTRREGDGVYYADINIGTPPQTFSVIVDTGSATIAVPCRGCDCGKQHHYFDISDSSSATVTTKSYRQCYSEGSCNEGQIVKDKICLGEACSAEETIDHSFGCCNKFASAFKAQEADGIIGLSGSEGTLVADLREHHKLERDQFSLCLGVAGGGVSIGGFMPERHLEPIQYLPLLQGSFYTIGLANVLVDGKKVLDHDIHNGPGKTTDKLRDVFPIVDSGTTFTYIPRRLHDELRKSFDSFCAENAGGNEERCIGEKNPPDASHFDLDDAVVCYRKPESVRYTEFISSFPSIELEFANGIQICLPPFSYFYVSKKGIFCVGLLRDSSSSNKMVLGAISLAGFDVIFDHENDRIGWARAVCDNPEDLDTDPTNETENVSL